MDVLTRYVVYCVFSITGVGSMHWQQDLNAVPFELTVTADYTCIDCCKTKSIQSGNHWRLL